MNTNEHEYGLDELVSAVVGAAYEVSNALGCGFLEKVYERALVRELELRGLRVLQQISYPIEYKGVSIGNYTADLRVEGRMIVELKCVDCFTAQHIAQALNYLRASNLKLALLINFQKPKVEWKRIVF
jgi:GxxExxY protein